jgi:hypothetical protein
MQPSSSPSHGRCKPYHSPFQSKVKLVCTTPKVDSTLYHKLVGSLLYLTHTHPNISFSICLVSQYTKKPDEIHYKEEKGILQYIWGTVQFGIYSISRGTPLLVGFTDSNWDGDLNDLNYTACYIFVLGS